MAMASVSRGELRQRIIKALQDNGPVIAHYPLIPLLKLVNASGPAVTDVEVREVVTTLTHDKIIKTFEDIDDHDRTVTGLAYIDETEPAPRVAPANDRPTGPVLNGEYEERIYSFLDAHRVDTPDGNARPLLYRTVGLKDGDKAVKAIKALVARGLVQEQSGEAGICHIFRTDRPGVAPAGKGVSPRTPHIPQASQPALSAYTPVVAPTRTRKRLFRVRVRYMSLILDELIRRGGKVGPEVKTTDLARIIGLTNQGTRSVLEEMIDRGFISRRINGRHLVGTEVLPAGYEFVSEILDLNNSSMGKKGAQSVAIPEWTPGPNQMKSRTSFRDAVIIATELVRHGGKVGSDVNASTLAKLIGGTPGITGFVLAEMALCGYIERRINGSHPVSIRLLGRGYELIGLQPPEDVDEMPVTCDEAVIDRLPKVQINALQQKVSKMKTRTTTQHAVMVIKELSRRGGSVSAEVSAATLAPFIGLTIDNASVIINEMVLQGYIRRINRGAIPVSMTVLPAGYELVSAVEALATVTPPAPP